MNEKQKRLEAELIQCWKELDEQIFGLDGLNLRTANGVITVVRPLFDKIFRAGYEQLADPMPRDDLLADETPGQRAAMIVMHDMVNRLTMEAAELKAIRGILEQILTGEIGDE